MRDNLRRESSLCLRTVLLTKVRDAMVCLLARAAAGRKAERKVREAIMMDWLILGIR